jgi:hypothetical protein
MFSSLAAAVAEEDETMPNTITTMTTTLATRFENG